MKKVRYDGEDTRSMPTLGKTVSKGDVVEVPDDFNEFNFSLVSGSANTFADSTKANKIEVPQEVPAVATPSDIPKGDK